MMKTLTLATALVLLAPLALAAPRAETQSYVYAGGTGTCASGVQTQNVGAACFRLTASDAGLSATITIADAVLGAIGAAYTFQTGATVLATGSFCGTTSATVPAGAGILRVATVGPNAVVPCAEAAGTTGTITVAYA